MAQARPTRRSIGPLLPVLASILALFAIVPAPVQAGFAPTRTLTEVKEFETPDVAVDSQGNALAVWDEPTTDQLVAPDQIKARRLTAAGELGPVFTVSLDGDNYQAAVAFAPDGRAFVAWRHSAVANEATGIEGRWVSPDGTLGELETFINGGGGVTDALEPRVAIDNDNLVSVLWRDQQGPTTFQGRRVGPNGLGGFTAAFGPGNDGEIVPLADGKTLAVWRQVLPNAVNALVWDANDSLTAPVALSVTPGAFSPRPVTRPDGDAFVVWRHQNPNPPYDDGVIGRRISGAGAPVGGELIIEPEAPGNIGGGALADSDSAGNVLAAWSRPDALSGRKFVHARRFDAAGSFAGPRQTISPDNDATVFAAALFDRGQGVLSWTAEPMSLLQGRAVDAQSAPSGPVADLANQAGRIAGDSDAAAGVAAFGARVVAPAGSAMVLSRYMVEPICSDVSATVVQGKPIAVPPSCSGPGVNGASAVTQPKHGNAGDGSALSYTPTPGFDGTDSFTYSGLNDGGGSAPATVTIKVGKDTVKPRIERFRLVTTRTKPADAAAKKKKKRKPATSYFALRFSEPATAKVTVEKPTRGVKKGKRCRARGKGVKGKRCTLYKRLGSVSSKTAAASVSIEMKGKLLKKVKVRKGRLRASAVATDPAGNKSNPKPLTIVKL